MKTIGLILLTIVVLLQSMNSFILFADYQINKAYYTKTLCENRFNSNSNCKGKCHLLKQLKKAESKDASPNQQKYKISNLFFCHQSSNRIVPNPTQLALGRLSVDFNLLDQPILVPDQPPRV